MAYRLNSAARLAEQFGKLPGVGRKTAQRYAFYVLSQPAAFFEEFAQTLLDAGKTVCRCSLCCNLSDAEICSVCDDALRDKSIICVVAEPRDVSAFERLRDYRGLYHVLHGLISPIDGIGPDELTVKQLLARLGDGVAEVVMATNPTVEGEATALYLSKLIKPLGIKVSRLAYGLPAGASLEYADDITLGRALEGRSAM